MSKVSWKPGTVLYPLPVVLVSCAGTDGRPNLITVAWTGIVCSDPPMLSVSIRPSRYSHRLIKETGRFVVNLPSERLTKATDYCGVKSGRDVDKFRDCGLTPIPSTKVGIPMVAECPISLECEVRSVQPLGTHDLFLGEIVAVNVEDQLLDDKGRMEIRKAGLIAYVHGHYWSLKEPLGKFGFSVQKNRKRNTRRRSAKG